MTSNQAKDHPDLIAICDRLYWANQHLGKADGILRAWDEQHNPHAVRAEYDDKASEVVLYVDGADKLPGVSLGLVVSDSVNQLRFCLDNLFWSCMTSFGKSARGHFPVFASESDWLGLRLGKVGQSAPSQFLDIVEKV